MRITQIVAPLALLTALYAQGCAIAKGLYVAIVHNSGAPSRADRARLDAREAELLRELRNRRVVILPVAVLGRVTRSDRNTATVIAEGLRKNGIAGTTKTAAEIRLPFEPQANEAAIFWSRFKALAGHVTAHPPSEADYVLLVDVFGAPERGSVRAVHAMAVTNKGEMAYRGLWNSHQSLYKEFRPRSLDDAARMVITDLERRSAMLADRSPTLMR